MAAAVEGNGSPDRNLVRIMAAELAEAEHRGAEKALAQEVRSVPMGQRGKQIHQLKIAPVFYDDTVARRKTAEIRLNDRGYQVGDVLILRPWTDRLGFLSAGAVRVVTHILDHEQFDGLQPNYVMLSFGDVP